MSLVRDFPHVVYELPSFKQHSREWFEIEISVPKKVWFMQRVRTNTRTQAHARPSLPLHKRNWHCHNSHLPHITQSSCVAAQWDPCPSGRVSVRVRAWGARERKGEGVGMTNFMAEKRIWLHVSWQSRYKLCHQRSDARICVSARITHISITCINKGDFDGVVLLSTGAYAVDTFAYGSRSQKTAEARGGCQSCGWQLCSGYGPPSAYWGILLMRIDVRFVTLILSIMKVPCLHRCILGRKKNIPK